MSVERETYTELVHSMIWAFAQGQLKQSQVASVLYCCAQPDTTEDTTDMTTQVREMLTDWSESDKGQLVCCETVRITFQCGGNIHGPCEKGHHTVQMTRVIGSMGWEPEEVSSTHDFQQVIMDATIALHPDGPGGKFVTARRGGGGPADLISTFKELFNLDENKIDTEVKDFRAELDKLFPSAPSTQEKGGSDDSP